MRTCTSSDEGGSWTKAQRAKVLVLGDDCVRRRLARPVAAKVAIVRLRLLADGSGHVRGAHIGGICNNGVLFVRFCAGVPYEYS